MKPEEKVNWQWAASLPHCIDEESGAVYMASSRDSALAALDALNAYLERFPQAWSLLVALDPTILEEIPIPAQSTAIYLAPSLSGLPKGCGAYTSVEGSKALFYGKGRAQTPFPFSPDYARPSQLRSAARKMQAAYAIFAVSDESETQEA